MKKHCLSRLMIVTVFLAGAALFAAAPSEGAPWVSLFNGQDLTGWTMKGSLGKAYVDKGELITHVTANTTEHTFVTSDQVFSDFILELDMKTDGGYNGGVLLRAVAAPAAAPVRLFAYMAKIDTTPRRWTGGLFEDFGGVWQWLYKLDDNAPGRAAYHNNEWNHFRFEVIGPTIKEWINDVPVANLIDDKYTKGYLAFKIHATVPYAYKESSLAHYRNIRVITSGPAKYATAIDLPAKRREKSGLEVPVGFRALIVTDGMSPELAASDQHPIRGLAAALNGNLYALADGRGIVALKDTDNDSRANVIETFGSPEAWTLVSAGNALYYATRFDVSRYALAKDNLVPEGVPEPIVSQRESRETQEIKYSAIDDHGTLLIVTGPAESRSSNTAMADKLWRFDAQKSGQSFLAGSSIAVDFGQIRSLTWNPVTKRFYIISEQTASDPGEARFQLTPIVLDETGETSKNKLTSALRFGSSAALAIRPGQRLSASTFSSGIHFPEKFRRGIFVGLADRRPARPNEQNEDQIYFLPLDENGKPTGPLEPFARCPSDARADPHARSFQVGGMTMGADGTLYVADAGSSRIWRVIYTAETSR